MSLSIFHGSMNSKGYSWWFILHAPREKISLYCVHYKYIFVDCIWTFVCLSIFYISLTFPVKSIKNKILYFLKNEKYLSLNAIELFYIDIYLNWDCVTLAFQSDWVALFCFYANLVKAFFVCSELWIFTCM